MSNRSRSQPARAARAVAEPVLPHNLEAERALLGAILVQNALYDAAAAIVGAEDFYRDAHRRVWQVYDQLLEWGGAADLVTVAEALAVRGDLETVGGRGYLAGLADGVPRGTNVAYYAAIVRDKAQLRRVIQVANDALGAAYAAEQDAGAILAAADHAFLALQRDGGTRTARVLRDGYLDLMAEIEQRAATPGRLSGVDTGFASINELTGGWQAGDLIILAARPSMGKTTLALNSAVAAAQAGTRVAFFSLEMRRRQLEYRLLASLADVPLTCLLGGHLLEAHAARVANALEVIRELPLYVHDQAGLSIAQIRAECRRLRSEEGLDAVVIDYVQLMGDVVDRRDARRYDQLEETSRRTKALAEELQLPVLLLSQLSRAPEKRTDPRPRLSDLRECGALEQDADVVGLLHRKNHREGGLTYLFLEKQRNGPTGTIKLSLDRPVVRFRDWSAPTTGAEVERDRYATEAD